MKKIYIVLTHTGTILSRLIRQYTKDEFSHCSISLDIDLMKMYSFGRLNPYNAFYGGFVHEGINIGTFKRFYNTRTKIYSLEVTDEQYIKIQQKIMYIEKNKSKYNFNYLGLFAAAFNKKLAYKNAFYCSEFVKYVLESSGVVTGLGTIATPEDFKHVIGLNEIYNGLLRKYRSSKLNRIKLLKEYFLEYSYVKV